MPDKVKLRNANSTIQKNVNISEEHYNKKSLIRIEKEDKLSINSVLNRRQWRCSNNNCEVSGNTLKTFSYSAGMILKISVFNES